MARELTPLQQALLDELVKIIRAYPLPENSPRLMTMEEVASDTKLHDIMRGELQKLADMRNADAAKKSNVTLHGILKSKTTPDWTKSYCTIHFPNKPSLYMTVQEAVDSGYIKITDIDAESK